MELIEGHKKCPSTYFIHDGGQRRTYSDKANGKTFCIETKISPKWLKYKICYERCYS